MAQIQEQFNIIKDVVKTNNKDSIIKIINGIHPLILMYYQMMNNSFECYTNKLPKEYFDFDIDEAIKMFIKIDDISFVNYIIKKFCYNKLNIDDYNKGIKIIEKLIEYYVFNDNINNINLLNNINFESINYFNINYFVINECIIYNKPNILKMFLMEPDNNHEDNIEPDEFKSYICSHIMHRGDLVEIVKVFHEYSIKYPEYINFDYNLVFNCALVNGREKCMEYALKLGHIDYYYYEEEKCDYSTINSIYPFTDSIMYAIIGKNINCIKKVFEIFNNRIDNIKIKEYFNFASVYGNLDIIMYMLNYKSHMVQIDNQFYNNILKFALCEGNIDIVKFAKNNGAIYSTDMGNFIEDYNDGRGPEEAFDNDFIDFYMKKYALPEDYKQKYIECMKYLC